MDGGPATHSSSSSWRYGRQELSGATSRLTGGAEVEGAGRLACSTPRSVVEDRGDNNHHDVGDPGYEGDGGGGGGGGGRDGVGDGFGGCEGVGGDGRTGGVGGEGTGGDNGIGGRGEGNRVRKGKGGTPCVSWTLDERKALWECYERTGGVMKGGYIKRTKELYDKLDLTPRSGPSLTGQVKRMDGGCGLTHMQKRLIRKKVRLETITKKVDAGVGLEEDEIVEIFGESFDDDYEMSDFSFEEGEDPDDDEDDENQGLEVDFVVEGEQPGMEPRVVLTNEFDTWKDSDGEVRLLQDDEHEVLDMLRQVRDNGEWKEVPNLRAVDRRKVMKEVALVDGVMHNMISEGMDVTDVNRLLYAGGVVVAMRLGLKLGAGKKAEVKKPWWQRRIERSITTWQKHLSQVEEIRRGKDVGKKVRKELEEKYQLTARGTDSVSTFLKNKIKAGSTKIRWFVEKKVARRQNNLFRNNQRQLYKELGGDTKCNTDEAPDADESRKFWSSIWSEEAKHDKDASWLGDVRQQMGKVRAMEDVVVTVDDVRKGIGRMSNWKAPGPEMVRGFWFKKLTSVHLVLTNALKECVERGEVPGWMVKGRTVLFQKDPVKGRAVSNYRPIACLPMMWKLLTGIFADKIYDHLHANSLLIDEQKGCRKRSRGTKDQLLIDRAVLRDAKLKKRFLSMAWIDYRKAYDMLPHSWILDTLGMVKVAKNIKGLLKRSMSDWKTVLTASGKTLGEVDIRRGIFQGDTLSPLLFVVAMIPLTLILRKEEMGYDFGASGKKINHLLFMDDLKLFGKNREDVEKLCEVVHKFSTDIGMEFGMDKCAVLEMQRGVKVECEGIVLPDGKTMREVEEEGYKYLGVLEAAGLKTKKMKELVRGEYLRRVKLVAGSKLYARSLMRAVNTWAVSVVRYTAGILDWRKHELKAMDVKTRKILTMKGVFHRKSNVDRLYLKRNCGGRGLISVAECVRKEELGLNEYVRSSDEWMLQVVAEEMPVGETKVHYEERVRNDRWNNIRVNKINGKYFNDVREVADAAGAKAWQWMRGGFIDKRTEGYVCAAQENALRTRLYDVTVAKRGNDSTCRLCGEEVESVGHLVCYCKKLRQTEFKRRHDKMGLRVYWEVCGQCGIKRGERWYEEVPDPVRKSADGRYEVWWDQKVSTPTAFEANRPDMVIIDHVGKSWKLVDFSVPYDRNVARVEQEKIAKYKDLAAELCRMHGVKTEVVPIVVGVFGMVSAGLVGWLRKVGVGDVVGGLQTSAVIGTAAILRKVLSTDA